LISEGGNVNVFDDTPKFLTPLHYAAACGHEDTVRLLIKYGSNLEARDPQGMTPLHVAAQKKEETFDCKSQIAILKVLIEFGAILDSRSNNGATALHYAAASNTVEAFPSIDQDGIPQESKEPSIRAYSWINNQQQPPVYVAQQSITAGPNPPGSGGYSYTGPADLSQSHGQTDYYMGGPQEFANDGYGYPITLMNFRADMSQMTLMAIRGLLQRLWAD
jgi:hypothetical protein